MIEDYYYRVLASNTLTMFLVGCMTFVAVYVVRQVLVSAYLVVLAAVVLFSAGLLGYVIAQDFGFSPTEDRAVDIIFSAFLGMAVAFGIAGSVYRLHVYISDVTTRKRRRSPNLQ